MVDGAIRAGFTPLFVQVRGRGDAFYAAGLEPRAAELAGQPADFDPLATTLALARPAGLDVHAWVNVNLVSSAATVAKTAPHVAVRHPEWLMVPRALATELARVPHRSPAYVPTLARWTRAASDRVEGLYLSPVHAEARAHTVGVVRDLATRYALDGIHLDYVRYPAEDFDFSAGALAAFRASRLAATPLAERRRLDRSATTDAAAWAIAQPREWAMFHRDRLTALVAEIREAVHDVRPEAQLTAAVLPSAAEARARKMQDWALWTQAGYLDALCPMIYTSNTSDFATALADVQTSAGDTPVWAGIGAYRLSVETTATHVRLVRERQLPGLVLFSWEQITDRGTSRASLDALRTALAADDPTDGRQRRR
jgi:uncharacterized lipoprotein YddW (UPF0748 family)